ncbi:MAG TPA: endonuclease [Desulfobacteraceae bacterium]|nr:endonuclease [Desulfobacteraceae bacterium]
MPFILPSATILLCVLTLLPLWRHPHWTVRGLDFPRIQLAAFAAFILTAQLAITAFGKSADLRVVLPALLCLVWHLTRIAPYSKFWPTEVKDCTGHDKAKRLSILTANVLTPNRDSARLIRVVRKYRPDILVTVESDNWWQDRLDTLAPEMPYAIKQPQDNLYGMHVYSRRPLENSRISFLVQDDVPSIHCRVTLGTGDAVQLHILHPAPPSPTENPKASQRDAELQIVARTVAENGSPTIVAGDLNDVAWSRTTRSFRKISGLLDPRVGRGMFNTFHARYPFIRWPLDHVFHSPHFTLSSIRRLQDIGSDHFPLFVELMQGTSQKAPQKKE